MDGREASRRVLLLAPMPSEMRPLAQAMSLQPAQLGALKVRSRSLGDTEILAARTGVGTEAAARTTERILGVTGIDHVVVVGIAGAVDAGARIGEVVVPEAVVDASTGEEYRSSPLSRLDAKGKILTSDSLVSDRDVLAEMQEKGIVALDMETAAVARVCDGRCAWSAIRAISDRATDGVLDEAVMGTVDPEGRPKIAAAARLVFSRPSMLPRLVRLARGANLAARAAASTAAASLGAR